MACPIIVANASAATIRCDGDHAEKSIYISSFLEEYPVRDFIGYFHQKNLERAKNSIMKIIINLIAFHKHPPQLGYSKSQGLDG